MAWVAVNQNGVELVFEEEPLRIRTEGYWQGVEDLFQSGDCVALPKGSIERLIGRKMAWEDEPVELEEQL